MSEPRGARERAEQHLADNPEAVRGICADALSKPGVVIIGVAIRGVGSCAIVLEAAEYDWRATLELLGKHVEKTA